jgi:hypothetical protein
MMIRTLSFLALAALLAGCGPNAASVRKQAQANADKYFEFLKAGDLQGAYDNTFSANYKRMLSPDSYIKFQQFINARAGDVQDYTADDDPKIDLDRHTVTFTYAVKTANLPSALAYDVKMVQEGSEWRIDNLEPKFPRTGQPPPSAPLPKKAPAPEAPAKKP